MEYANKAMKICQTNLKSGLNKGCTFMISQSLEAENIAVGTCNI